MQSVLFENDHVIIHKEELHDKALLRKSYKGEVSYKNNAKLSLEKDVLSALFGNDYGILENDKGKYILVRNYYDGEVLSKIIGSEGLSPELFFKLAIKIVNELITIHNKGIIHCDISPDNIIINKNDWSAKIIDFGISSFYTFKSKLFVKPNKIEGSLHYLSPEQTGRVNRVLDFRSDLYSFGATLYKMVSGKELFSSSDPLEIIHAHIAKEINFDLPQFKQYPLALVDFIAKLLQKDPELRYNSTQGVLRDLELLYKAFVEDDSHVLTLGELDFPTHFLVSQKIVGRDKEIKELINVFDHVTKGNGAFVQIEGAAGIGKSMLVQELIKNLSFANGIFLSGKYDQYNRSLPYAAWKKCIDQFIDHLLTESDDVLADWKLAFEEKVVTYSSLLYELFPRLSLVFGHKEKSVTHEDGANVLEIAIKEFLTLMTKDRNPIVVFLDDMQWADLDSIKLMKTILKSSTLEYFMIITANRDNEVNAEHDFVIALEDLVQEGIRPDINLHLKELSQDDLGQLLVNSHVNKSMDFQRLVEKIHLKTSGNPFFINMFLSHLEEEKILFANRAIQKWDFDIENIDQLSVTSNVIDILLKKISHEDDLFKKVMNRAACVGNEFTNQIILIISSEINDQDIRKSFHSAIKKGFIYKVKTNYKEKIGTDLFVTTYRFVHDRIQQSFYDLFPVQQRKNIHYSIGHELLKNAAIDDQMDAHIFRVLSHLNQGIEFVKNDIEKTELAELNLTACLLSKRAFSFDSAYQYAELAKNLQESVRREDKSSLFDVYYECAINDCLRGNHTHIDRWVTLLLQNTSNTFQQLQARFIKIKSLSDLSKREDCIHYILEVLQSHGVKLHFNVSTPKIIFEFIKTKIAYSKVDLDGINISNKNVNKEDLLIDEILMKLAESAFFITPNLYPVIICTLMRRALKVGFSDYTMVAFGSYALMLSGPLGDPKNALLFANVTERMILQSRDKRLISIAIFAINAFVYQRFRKTSVVIKSLTQGSKIAMESGEYEYASFNLTVRFSYGMFSGENLNSLQHILNDYKETLRFLEEKTKNHAFDANISQVKLLRDETSLLKPIVVLDKEKEVSLIEKQNGGILTTYYMFYVYVYFLSDNISGALKSIEQFDEFSDSSKGSFLLTLHHMIVSIIYYRCKTEKRKITKSLQKGFDWAHKDVEKWHKINCITSEPIFWVLKAEKERYKNRFYEALDFYHKGLKSAQDHDLPAFESVIMERTASCFLLLENILLYEQYLYKAYELYAGYGNKAKANWLKVKFGDIISAHQKGGNSNSVEKNLNLDLRTILKYSEAISSEIELEKLILKLTALIIENVGAHRGLLFLSSKNRLSIRAVGDMERGVSLYQGDMAVNYSERVLNFVSRSKEAIVLGNAIEDDRFKQEKYVADQRLKSVLCVPILNKNELVGVFYLENNFTQNVFSIHQLELLQMLSGQVAISLENALLYDNLESKVKERTAELAQKNKELDSINTSITSSISYALTIQNAILPTRGFVKTILPQSFIFFRPRDVVSGDFYWVNEKNGKKIIMAIDCTGHGVPGAFMSLIGNTLLNQIIHENDITDPVLILEELHKNVVSSLKQKETENKDGMDVSVCVVDEAKKEIEFAGANNSIMIIRDQEFELVKGTRRCVGGVKAKKEKPFEKQVISYKNTVSCYMYTDGILDQFGGEDVGKFMTKGLKELLLEIKDESIDIQAVRIEEKFNHWKGSTPQIDDVLMIGFSV